jgi:hypothetical protein
MNNLTDFLINPNETGVCVKTYTVGLEKIEEFYQHTHDLVSKFKLGGTSEFVDRILSKDINEQRWELKFRLATAFSFMIANEKKCKPQVCDFFKFKPEDLETIEDSNISQHYKYRRFFTGGFLTSRIYPEHTEILYVDFKISKRKKLVLIEVISLKETGLKLFDDLISCLPVLQTSVTEISKRKSHSEKNIFKVYPMAIDLWIDEEDKFLLNENLKNFLNASVKYYFQKEFRTSIILSSIAVESIFAELFEEAYKKTAPDIPLGGLIKQVKEKIPIPEDISVKISDLNKARIASVHRSEDPVSDKDSIVSMMGVAALIKWYLENY